MKSRPRIIRGRLFGVSVHAVRSLLYPRVLTPLEPSSGAAGANGGAPLTDTIRSMALVDGELLIVRCIDGVARLRAGVLDDPARRAYQLGQCHALSIVMHESTGWPIEVVVARRGRRDRIDWDAMLDDASKRFSVVSTRWVHTAVRRPDGLLIDITGAWDESALLRRWAPPRTTDGVRLIPVSAEALIGLARHGSGVDADLDAARSFVGAVLRASNATQAAGPF